jgi:hypothetical protein
MRWAGYGRDKKCIQNFGLKTWRSGVWVMNLSHTWGHMHHSELTGGPRVISDDTFVKTSWQFIEIASYDVSPTIADRFTYILVILINFTVGLQNHSFLRFSQYEVTERRGRVVNTPASYSWGSGFKSRPGDRLSWLRFFVVIFSLSRRRSE